MRRFFKLLSIKLRLWYYRRWYYKYVKKYMIDQKAEFGYAYRQANNLFILRWGKDFWETQSRLSDAASALRYGYCPQQQAQPETEQESQT